MATITYTGSNLRYKAANWNNGQMRQGAYYSLNSGKSLTGQCQFAGLSNFDTAANTITKITLSMTFTTAGKSAVKAITAYMADTTDEEYKLSVVNTAAAAYNRVTTIEYTAQTDLDKITEAIVKGNEFYTLYNGETKTGSSYSTNYLAISAITLTIEYEEKPQNGCMSYYHNGVWVWCRVRVYNNNGWHDVKPHYYNNGSWHDTN